MIADICKKSKFAEEMCLWALLMTPLVVRSAPVDEDPPPAPEAEMQSWLLRNPAFLLDRPDILTAIKSLEVTREIKRQQTARAATLERNAKLLIRISRITASEPPAAGPYLIAFIDYDCLPCRADAKVLESVKSKNASLSIIEIPVGLLGSASRSAVAAVLAAAEQRRSQALHKALLSCAVPLSYGNIIGCARSVGLNIAQLERDMRSKDTDAKFDEIAGLANELGVTAVPTYLIGCELHRGRLNDALATATPQTCESQ